MPQIAGDILIQWAMDTFVTGIIIADDLEHTITQRNRLARREARRIIRGVNRLGLRPHDHNKEFAKRVIRRVNQIVNDGLPPGAIG